MCDMKTGITKVVTSLLLSVVAISVVCSVYKEFIAGLTPFLTTVGCTILMSVVFFNMIVISKMKSTKLKIAMSIVLVLGLVAACMISKATTTSYSEKSGTPRRYYAK